MRQNLDEHMALLGERAKESRMQDLLEGAEVKAGGAWLSLGLACRRRVCSSSTKKWRRRRSGKRREGKREGKRDDGYHWDSLGLFVQDMKKRGDEMHLGVA